MDPAFWLEELPVSETMMIVAHGELDLEAAPELSESLQVHRRTAGRIVVDLREVTFMDSSGLAALAVNASDRDGLAPVQILAPVQHQPLHLLELTGLANLFTDHDAVG